MIDKWHKNATDGSGKVYKVLGEPLVRLDCSGGALIINYKINK